jgi:hypothetical protein
VKTRAPYDRHPEQSAAESKDPADELNVMLRDSWTSLGMTANLSAPHLIFWLEVSLDVVSLELGIYEILLAGETRAVLLFVV